MYERQGSRPSSLWRLVKQSRIHDYDPTRPIKDQLYAADILRQRGMQYLREDDYERAFVHLLKAALIIEKLPDHTEYNSLKDTHKDTLAWRNDELVRRLETLELKMDLSNTGLRTGVGEFVRSEESFDSRVASSQKIVQPANSTNPPSPTVVRFDDTPVIIRVGSPDTNSRQVNGSRGARPLPSPPSIVRISSPNPQVIRLDRNSSDNRVVRPLPSPPSTIRITGRRPESREADEVDTEAGSFVENGFHEDHVRTETYLQILRRFQGFAWPHSSASRNYDKLDLSEKVTWEPSATARGHFADVHKGSLVDSQIAVKLLRLPAYNPYTKDDYEHTYLRFFREMTLWAELKHTNIVTMLGFTAAKGVIGLVSLWHSNGNLVDHLAANPSASVPDLMLDVAEGTQYLHDNAHLAHGDLKGMNVLINEHGIACLADFGVSQKVDDLSRHTGFTTLGLTAGTLHWMAPEVVQGNRPNYPSDVYSCAGVFLEIRARKCPFYYSSRANLIVCKQRGELPTRSQYPELDGKDSLWNLFCRCWDNQPGERPTIGMVVKDLYEQFRLGARPFDSVAPRPLEI